MQAAQTQEAEARKQAAQERMAKAREAAAANRAARKTAADNPVKAEGKVTARKVGIRKERLHKGNVQAPDMFSIPEETITLMRNEGFSAEWKVTHIYGQAVPSNSMIFNIDQGWQPARPDMFGGALRRLVPAGYSGNTIERGGQILMIRETYLCEESRLEQQEAARIAKQTEMVKAGVTPVAAGIEQRVRPGMSAPIQSSFEAPTIPQSMLKRGMEIPDTV